MPAILPILFVQNGVLRIIVHGNLKHNFYKGKKFTIRSNDGKNWNITVLDRVVSGAGEIISVQLNEKDPECFMDAVCTTSGLSKRKQNAVVDLLDMYGSPVENIPRLEVHPY